MAAHGATLEFKNNPGNFTRTPPAAAVPGGAQAHARNAGARPIKADTRLTLLALAPRTGEIILDLGCGSGRSFRALAQARCVVVGIDASLAVLRGARKKLTEAALVLGEDWDSLPFVNGHFDAVLCALAGEHLHHMHAVLREAHRVLKPGGRLVLSLHYPELAGTEERHASTHGMQDNLFEVDLALRTGAFRHSVQDYLAALKAAGFVDIRQHQTPAHGRQQSLFPEENLRAEQEEFPNLVVLQALRAK